MGPLEQLAMSAAMASSGSSEHSHERAIQDRRGAYDYRASHLREVDLGASL